MEYGKPSFEGKVLAVEGEKVKLHLNIDKNQNKHEAASFPYAPPTGNAMYPLLPLQVFKLRYKN